MERPPREFVQRSIGCLVEEIEVLECFPVSMYCETRLDTDMYTGSGRRHLHFDENQPQMLYCASRADTP